MDKHKRQTTDRNPTSPKAVTPSSIGHDLSGLSAADVEARRRTYGTNEIPEKEETLAKRIAKRFWGPRQAPSRRARGQP